MDARNARRKFVPASDQQILVTSNAWSLSGLDYRYRISAWASGEVDPLAASCVVDSLDVAPRAGSGLSVHNLVTPWAVVTVLRHMRSRKDGGAYRRALAEPGEEHSTLERRLPEPADRLFAKTGTISNVNSLSGYLVRSGGSQVIFSILTNGSGLPASVVRNAMDDVVRVPAR